MCALRPFFAAAVAVPVQIRTIDRKQEVPHDGAMCDLLWSDPGEAGVLLLTLLLLRPLLPPPVRNSGVADYVAVCFCSSG